jgi:hypothetical protein
MEKANQQSETRAAPTLADVAQVIQVHYREELWLAVKAIIGVISSLSFKKRDHCLVLVLEGPPGQGKSIAIRVAMPDRESTKGYLVRVDDFTPASFVSHAANRSKKQLEKIDLLPRVKDKVMLTKELAPVFRDEEKELRKNFARLISVLDGDGYVTNSGTQGQRGYEDRHIFNWIGATTPIPERTHKVMAQLGNRILFYEIAGEESSDDDLMEFACTYGTSDTVQECRRVVNDFVESHFQRHPPESIDPESILLPEPLLRQLVRYATLICRGRVEVENQWGTLEVGPPEGPQRVILLLQTLARGLALAEGRSSVNSEDLALIRHIAFSSIPQKRRESLRALLAAGGEMDTRQVEEALDMSPPTALERMKELDAVGLYIYTEGKQHLSKPAKVTLAEEFKWLLEETTPPLSESGV